MLKKLIAIGSIVASFNCFAGELVTNATVLEVASNGSNATNFAVKVEGGSGLCSGWIYFSEAKAPSIASYNQSFS
ncbi:MAG: DUF5992 family protein, partial [Sedimenticola sp.]|nr:DUF5992 family protein [Sedimenticola sp.]